MTTSPGKHAGPRPADEADGAGWLAIDGAASRATSAAVSWAEDDRDQMTDEFLASIAAEAGPRAGLPTGLDQPWTRRGRSDQYQTDRGRPRSHAADTGRTGGAMLVLLLVLLAVVLAAGGILAWTLTS